LKHKISIIKSSTDCILILVIRDTKESKAIKIKKNEITKSGMLQLKKPHLYNRA
jgi:hypothetical protein